MELVVGKLTGPLLLGIVQQVVLFVVGGAIYGLDLRPGLLATLPVSTVFILCVVALGMLLSVRAGTVQQVAAVGNLLTILLGGLAGALAPGSLLPGWAQAVAPATPGYWAMEGFRAVLLEGGGTTEVLVPTLVLLGFAALCFLAVARLFDPEETKVSWA